VLSGTVPENIPEAATMLMAHVPQMLWSQRSKFILNCVGRVIIK
jgi:hypothetical protein